MADKVLCLFPIIFVVIRLSGAETVSVKTTIGVINGLVEDVSFLGKSSRIHKFLGIPFAEPPIGKLRFQKSVPKSPLEEPLDAFNHNSACLQMKLFDSKGLTYNEDCLYLNIYAPERKSKDSLLPVMVWIYGGGFAMGFSDWYIGDHLATHGDVIVVTLNYRVSIWGFLSTGDKHAPGNYGLWDQHMAIRWVHDNIIAFGGDTEKVTLFGESAGSASVMHQALYPGNKGLFQRVIGQSGSVGNFWASNEKNTQNAKQIGALAECEKTEDSEALVACLRGVSPDRLVEFVSDAKYGFTMLPFPFLPTLDGDFVTTNPKHTFDRNTNIPSTVGKFFSSLDMMTGVTSAEGSLCLGPFAGVNDAYNFLPNRTFFEETLVPLMIQTCIGDNVPQIAIDSVIEEYTNWENPDDYNNVREDFLSMWGDATFTGDLYKTLDAHSKLSSNQRTYMYVLDIEPDFIHPLLPLPWLKKIGHGEDLSFVFGFKNPDQLGEMFHVSPSGWEERLSVDIMTMWTNFAKTGNPNSPEDLGLDWLPYTRKHQHYLQISRDMTSLNVKQRWNTRRANFWINLLPNVVKSARQGTCEKDKNCHP